VAQPAVDAIERLAAFNDGWIRRLALAGRKGLALPSTTAAPAGRLLAWLRLLPCRLLAWRLLAWRLLPAWRLLLGPGILGGRSTLGRDARTDDRQEHSARHCERRMFLH
jgi:hypothetical protein